MSNHPVTLYWHDYETFGTDPGRDRPAQFAGLRTDPDLNPIGQPLVIYCKPAGDMLPHPEACLITGITPQRALEKGAPEADFIRQIHDELSQPGTCGAGYNSIRFDDEVTRYTLYRNFFEPYAREWQNGNSRWDIIDLLRACYALRPEGITWPKHPDGKPSFRLEDLTAANNIGHESAHDALSDVQATIALARLVKTKQPRLYDYAFKLRSKKEVLPLLNVRDKQAMVHTSSKYPSEHGCTSVVVPVALHPTNKNGIVAYDLRYSPEELLTMNADTIRERLFTRTEDLPDGAERVHLKTVHINKCPFIAPLSTLTTQAAERLHIDLASVEKNLAIIRNAKDLENRIQQALSAHEFENNGDPDTGLYSGFFSDTDRERIATVRRTAPEMLGTLQLSFEDARLPELFFRYRARNWPHTLNPEERQRWEEYRIARLTRKDGGSAITLEEYEARLRVLAENENFGEREMGILEELAEYGAAIL
jgi:exodeoxyribonuclease-1